LDSNIEVIEQAKIEESTKKFVILLQV